jgi:hypothetical protein
MAVSDLITSIRYQLHDTDSNNWTGAEILDYINRGHRLIWAEMVKNNSDLVHKATSGIIYASGDNYDTPSDFWTLDFLQIEGEDSPLSAVDYAYIKTYVDKFGDEGGTPTVYAIYNGGFHVRPIPTADVTLNIYYFYKPSTLTSTSDSPFNDITNEALIAFAVGMCLVRDERSQSRQDKIISQLLSSAMSLFGRRDKSLKRINAYRWEYEELV